MAYVNNSTMLRNDSTGTGLAGIVAKVKLSLQRRAVYNRTVRDLLALSDRDLSDLGINRTQINQIAREAAYGK
jgi:uncharacterized protein YjiS (DUF1127 family)